MYIFCHFADAWLTNVTHKIYLKDWRESENLWDSNSPKFKEYEQKFCNEVSNYTYFSVYCGRNLKYKVLLLLLQTCQIAKMEEKI